MCTLTILRTPERTLVTMNRDEARVRAVERPPRLVEASGRPSWLAPTDGEKGGTWFGANDRGLVAGLLNAYVPGDLALYGRDDVPSRGTIIPQLASRSPEQARAWLHNEFDPTPFPSFTLVVVTPDHAERYRWRLDSGVATEPIGPGWSMVTSSLWRADQVEGWRHDEFARWRDDGASEVEGVPTFNLLERPGREEWSPFVTRSFSLTRSITQTEIRAGEAHLNLRYWLRDGEGPVDPTLPTTIHQLPLEKNELTRG